MKTLSLLIPVVCLMLLAGCAPSEGKKLYNEALEIEQRNPIYPWASIPYYQLVIIDAPGTEWAQKAQQRLDVILQRKAAFDAGNEARIRGLMPKPVIVMP